MGVRAEDEPNAAFAEERTEERGWVGVVDPAACDATGVHLHDLSEGGEGVGREA